MGLLYRALILHALLGCLCLAIAKHSTSKTSFVFNGFQANNLSLSGIATLNSGVIELTNVSTRVFGRALYPRPVHLKSSFSNITSSFGTTFVFSITPMYPTLGGHGMAFLMTPSMNPTGALPSQYLGLVNATNEGSASNHLFAVEFDTVQDLEFGDIDGNHIGIDVNGMRSIYSKTATYRTRNSTKEEINLKGSQDIQAWIQYSGLRQQLNVSIAPVGHNQPIIPLLSVHVDLSNVLENFMYVGFSGSTGVLSGIHRVLAWSFNTNGSPQSLDLSQLPSIDTGSSRFPPKRIIMILSVAAAFLLIGALVIAAIWRVRSQREVVEEWELDFSPLRYSYRDLKTGTQGFHEKNMVGQGGFGPVYKGVLPTSGHVVAVKRLSRDSDQGQREFLAEMSSTIRLRHRNLVQLLGWSRFKGELLLVYDYMPNGSLDKMLFGSTRNLLSWEQRYKILSGVASGMFYLHEGWEQQILHRDVKSSNVLLDAELNGRLGDFGLARLYEHGKNPHTTRIVGTLGYLAPEFSRTGKATPSTDVFSFGALLLEVATGRRPIENQNSEEDFILVDCVWDLYTKESLIDAADPRLCGNFDVEEMERVLVLGLLCSHPKPSERPAMRQVVQVLAGDASLRAPSPGHGRFHTPANTIFSEGTLSNSSFLRSGSISNASSVISAR